MPSDSIKLEPDQYLIYFFFTFLILKIILYMLSNNCIANIVPKTSKLNKNKWQGPALVDRSYYVFLTELSMKNCHYIHYSWRLSIMSP